ncbi:MAG TPA: hypothetical protein VMZ73_00315 [Acidimicrobiales bacterium]|nr:hypothetical protein [Acidimicrobiales bacterium]
MIHTSDPLERLRAVNPVPAAEVELLDPDPVLFHRITSAPPARIADPLRRRRRRRLVPALMITSVLGGAVAYGVLRGGVTNPETVACFERADLLATTAVRNVEAAGLVETCAEVWRQGTFVGTEVPPLMACVLPTGVAGVFPTTAGTDVCTALNLVPISATPPTPPPPPATTTPGPAPAPQPTADLNTRILAFRDAALGQFADAPCVAPATGADIVRRELDRAGLADWTVVSGAFTADRPCATLSLRPEERQVLLVPGTPRR